MPVAAAHARPPHPPLAHDARGNPLALPDGAAGWRVKRQTAGRPRVCVGPDREPLRFSLETTAADLLDMLGPGAYRLDAIDEVGEVLDYVTTVQVGLDASSDVGDERDARATIGAPRSPATGGGSDLRFALEVTAQMARAQSDALRSIADAQAEWIKGLAAAKAIPRNGFVRVESPPPPPPVADDEDDEEDDEEDEDEAPTGPDPMGGVNTALGHCAAIAEHLSPLVGAILPSKRAAVDEAPRNAAPNPPPAQPEMDHATQTRHIAKVLVRLSPRALDMACKLMALDDADSTRFAATLCEFDVERAIAEVEELAASIPGKKRKAPPPGQTVNPTAPPVDFVTQFEAVKSRLTPVEIMKVMKMVAGTPAEQLEEFKAHLLTLSPDDAAAWIRQALIAGAAPATAGGEDVEH